MMKDALLKAGVITEKDIKKSEAEKSKKRSRLPVAKAATEKKHDHHVVTICQECQKAEPDVEHYRHTIKHLKSFWLCCKCADMFNIHDKFRVTAQSPHAMSGMFRREYGPTLNNPSIVARRSEIADRGSQIADRSAINDQRSASHESRVTSHKRRI